MADKSDFKQKHIIVKKTTSLIDNIYVILNARGTKIQVKKHLLSRSKRLTKQIKSGKTEIYINRSAKDVHNFIDYLSGNMYKNSVVIDDMIDYCKVELDDAKKFECALIQSIFEKNKRQYKVQSIEEYENVLVYNIHECPNSYWMEIIATKLLKYKKYHRYIIIKNRSKHAYPYTIYLIKKN